MSKHKMAMVAKIGRWIRSRFVSDGLILLYHRVSDPKIDNEPDPYSLCVTPENFAGQMKWLHDFTNPMSLQTMIEGLKNKYLPPRAIAVTFDDGYADNLYQAKPIIERYNIPATVFLISGCIGGSFWWDEIARIIFLPQQLPDHLSLNLNGHSIQIHIESNNNQARKRLLKKIHGFIRLLHSEERNAVITRLRSWAGVYTSTSEVARPMTRLEILKLVENDLVEIGSHTVSHPSLSALDTDQQEEEIRCSKIDIEDILNRKIHGFSYPYGLKADLTSHTVKKVQESGFKYACTNMVDSIWSQSDSYQLPRYWVNDISVREFEYRINSWLSKKND